MPPFADHHPLWFSSFLVNSLISPAHNMWSLIFSYVPSKKPSSSQVSLLKERHHDKTIFSLQNYFGWLENPMALPIAENVKLDFMEMLICIPLLSIRPPPGRTILERFNSNYVYCMYHHVLCVLYVSPSNNCFSANELGVRVFVGVFAMEWKLLKIFWKYFAFLILSEWVK